METVSLTFLSAFTCRVPALLIAIFFTLFTRPAYSQYDTARSLPVIFDSDMGPDYDDVGALAVLHVLADSGYVHILATVSSNKMDKTTQLLRIINTYYGRPHLPVGIVKGKALNIDAWHKGIRWTDALVKKYPLKLPVPGEDALAIYRSVLAKQKDHSTVIICTGFFTNLKNLLLSQPDSISRLNGMELVRKKVKHIVCMAGRFPRGKEYNIPADIESAKIVFKEWPTSIICSGAEIGRYIRTGDRLIESTGTNNPVKDAYEIAMKQDMNEFDNSRYEMGGRASYDQTAVLAAARELGTYFNYETGRVVINNDGSNGWIADPNGKHMILKNKFSFQHMARVIEDLMIKEPLLNVQHIR